MRLREFDGDRERERRRYRDPELLRQFQQVRSHYPLFRDDPEAAFIKYVQRALKHSKETDRRHDRDLRNIQKQLQTVLQQLK